ncbi:MAG: hypothetical protein K8R46_06410 [Pirellulales bacterium]|nr:hypothetical protein [Pirellulales bacterium]
MAEENRMSVGEKKLVRRYLIWCYKTTKEDLDRIDRYFTQMKADEVILSELNKRAKKKDKALASAAAKKAAEFKLYMNKKTSRALSQKYRDVKKKILDPDYVCLKDRLSGIERAIVDFLGKKEMKTIQDLYEEEMTQRILTAREHT